jgi:hypothetical protein
MHGVSVVAGRRGASDAIGTYNTSTTTGKRILNKGRMSAIKRAAIGKSATAVRRAPLSLHRRLARSLLFASLYHLVADNVLPHWEFFLGTRFWLRAQAAPNPYRTFGQLLPARLD